MTYIRLSCGCRYERENGLNVFSPCALDGEDATVASAIESSLADLTDELQEITEASRGRPRPSLIGSVN